MSSPLSDQSFLSSLKHHHAVRNRSNNATSTPSPSKRANRLPALPEHEYVQLKDVSSWSTARISASFPSPPSSTDYSTKRQSRYGKIEFTRDSSSTLPDDFLSAAPRVALRPPSLSVKPRHQLTSLSPFDIIIVDPSSEPASLVSETPGAYSTPPRSRAMPHRSPSRSCSPAPSLTSTSSTCSSADVPRTPDSSDDEWLNPRTPRETLARPRLANKQLILTKSTPSPPASDTSLKGSFEFTVEPFSFLPDLEDEEEEDRDQEEEGQEQEQEQNALWYSHELGQVLSLFPHTPSYDGRARPDSFPPPPRGSSLGTGTGRPRAHSRMSKPVPPLPLMASPSPQLDPTFPRPKSYLPPLPNCESPYPITPPSLHAPHSSSPTAPAAAAVPSAPRESPTPPVPTQSRPSVRKSLMITVPRPNPSTQLPLDVSDILDEIDAWSFYSPTTSTSTSTVMLSPPRVPHSPSPPPTTSSASALEKRDAIKFVVSGASAASRPPSSPTPSMSTTIYATTAAANNCSDHEDYDENRFCSHQSFSPLDLPVSSVGAAAAAQAPIANPALRRFQIGSVVRRMRMRRAASDGSKGSKDAAATPKVATPARTTSAPALGRRPQRQRKPIPF